MPNIIKHKRSTTAGLVPGTGALDQAELAINIADGKLYTKNSGNTIINLGVTSISGTFITPNSGNFINALSLNNNPVWHSGNFDTANIVKGTGTGASISGYLPRWTSSSGLSNSAIYQSGNNIGIGTTSPITKLDIAGTLKVNGDPIVNEGATLEVGQYSIGISTYNGTINIESSTAGDGTITIGNGFNDTTNINSTFTNINGWTFEGDYLYNNNGYLTIFNLLSSGDNSNTNTNLNIGDYTKLNHINWNIDQNGNAFFNGNITCNSGNFTNNLTVGGNLTVNGSVVTANVDRMEIEDPIITLGLASGNIVTTNTLDRGLALVRGTSLTAFMGWDSSASQFVMLSSGVATNSSGNYDAGTYGNLRINDLISNTGTFNGSLQVGGPARFTIGAGGFGFQIDRGNIDPGFGGDILKLDVNNAEGVGYSTTLMSNAPGNDIIIKLPADSGTLARISDINTSQITGVLSVTKGGTNRSTYSNGQLLIGSGTSLVANTLAAGTGITITNGSGTITIATTGLANYDVSVLSLGTISGSNAINCGQDRQIQNLTLNGSATTFTKGSGWPTSDSVAREATLNIFSSGNTSVTWTVVNDWYRQPDSPLPSGRHIVLLRSIGSGTMQGHYIGNKTN